MVDSIYGDIPMIAVKGNHKDIVNQIYKLLPLKEHHNPNIDSHFASLLFRIRGMSSLFPNEPRWVTVLALIESARLENNDFQQFRKAVLDSCSIVGGILDNHA